MVQTVAVTLTYCGDSPNCALLIYKDFQDFMKRLRAGGFNVRYIVVGEYGSKNGRAHWHAILFFRGKPLKVVDTPDERGPWDIIFPRFKDDDWARIQWAPWSKKKAFRGFAYFQEPDYGAMEYVLKYVTKDIGGEVSQYHLAMSKYPPLGDEFFITDLANRYIRQSLSPQNPEYSFRDIFASDGKRRKFWLQGRMREIFCEYFIWAYRSAKGREYPFTEFLELTEDKQIAKHRLFAMTDDEWQAMLSDPLFKRGRGVRPPDVEQEVPPPSDGQYLMIGENRMVVRRTDGRIDVVEGEEAWRVENVDQMAVLLREIGVSRRLGEEITNRLGGERQA